MKAKTISDVVLLEDGIVLPGTVPVSPPDTKEDPAQADGHDPGKKDHLYPADDVEGIHVDQCAAKKRVRDKY